MQAQTTPTVNISRNTSHNKKKNKQTHKHERVRRNSTLVACARLTCKDYVPCPLLLAGASQGGDLTEDGGGGGRRKMER